MKKKIAANDAIFAGFFVSVASFILGGLLRFGAQFLSGVSSSDGTITVTTYNAFRQNIFSELGLILLIFGFALTLLTFHHWFKYTTDEA